MRVLALYLPQFHRTKENDKWWGEGYTEWNAVKNGKKYIKNQYQPKVPLNKRYYDLVNDGIETLRWQAKLINEYDIYGLCMYHYWFNGKLMLEKPMEILRDNKDINIKYCICWANEAWSRTWDGTNNMLINQAYGGKTDIINHFNYLSTFFKDERYIKIDNKPIVHLYRSKDITYLNEMINIWNKLAKENGFNGIYWISAMTSKNNDERDNLFDHYYYFEPGYTLKYDMGKIGRIKYLANGCFRRVFSIVKNKKDVERIVNILDFWKRIEKRKIEPKYSPGTLVNWDNTARKKENGTIFINSSPNSFKNHLKNLSNKYDEKEFLYINAWNEWSEGAYLEPDEKNEYEYLKAIRER